MTIKKRSAKNKGREFQNEVVDLIKTGMALSDDDIRSTPASVNGVDIIFSTTGQEVFPYSVECKRVEKLSIWDALEQAVRNAVENTVPILVFRRNRGKTYVTLEFDVFLRLAKIANLFRVYKQIQE